MKTTDQILLEAIQELRTDVGRIDRDLGKDREAMETMAMVLSTFKERIDQFSKQLSTQQKQVQDKVADVVEPLMGQIEDKKVVEYKTRPWYKFWRG